MNFWKFRTRRKHAYRSHCKDKHCSDCRNRQICTLRDVPAGNPVVIKGYLDQMPAHRRTQLMAYGLHPGQLVKICQQYPVTIIQIDFTELALEWDLAEAVQVDIA